MWRHKLWLDIPRTTLPTLHLLYLRSYSSGTGKHRVQQSGTEHWISAGGAQSVHKSSSEELRRRQMDSGMEPVNSLLSSKSSSRDGRLPAGTSGSVPVNMLPERYKSTNAEALEKSGRVPENMLPWR